MNYLQSGLVMITVSSDSNIVSVTRGLCRDDGREGQPRRRIWTWYIQTLWTKGVDEGVGELPEIENSWTSSS